MTPEQALQKVGSITLSDGASYFTFGKKGIFVSGPLSISGRSMHGYWERNKDGYYVATVRMTWINGSSRNDDFARIIFSIRHLTRNEKREKPRGMDPRIEILDGYYYIEELKRIPRPEKEIPLQPPLEPPV